MSRFTLYGNIIDLQLSSMFSGCVTIDDGRIVGREIVAATINPDLPYILPGFIDSHVHIESSMLIPSEFARLAVVHGTVATVSDPHEIANVCGMDGIEYMINNGRSVNFKFYFGAPSCVPATIFETSGGAITVEDVHTLLQRKEIRYLSEMMNFPGVLSGDETVLKKINAARQKGKPVDGHAPGLRGGLAAQYASSGITTDHECFTREEALDKLRCGMKILIREGSAAKNFDALIDLLHDFPDQIMFCSDDKHPDSLVQGHINQLCERAVSKGVDVFHILKAACLNPVIHYGLDTGLLQVGDPADFIVVEDVRKFKTVQTYINGQKVADSGNSLLKSVPTPPINNFHCQMPSLEMFQRRSTEMGEGRQIPVIEALDGQLITNCLMLEPTIREGMVVSDTERDILKIAVVNRYRKAPVAVAFIKNFNLRRGAIASSVAHDSHNIIAVGADDQSLCDAINLIIAHQGGVSCVDGEIKDILPLPVAGLMSGNDGYAVAEAYTRIDRMAKSLGSGLSAPFMTLSFMALLVIPSLKLSDRGLFDGERFQFV